MLTKEDLQLLSGLMDEKLKPINERLDNMQDHFDNMQDHLDNMQDQLDEIKENTEITRDVLNEVVKWIDSNFRDDYPFPVEKQII